MDESISERSVAEFFGWCLRQGWDCRRGIIRWADHLIATSLNPADWMIELSTSNETAEGMIACVREVPGTASTATIRRLKIGFLQTLWPSGQLGYEDCLRMLDDLASGIMYPESGEGILESEPKGMLLSIVYDHADWDTPANIRRMIDELLRAYPDHAALAGELIG